MPQWWHAWVLHQYDTFWVRNDAGLSRVFRSLAVAEAYQAWYNSRDVTAR